MSALKDHVASLSPQGINLMLLVCRQGNHLVEEVKKFKYILRRLSKDQVPLVTACIINGCADYIESERLNLISQIHTTPRTQVISQFSLQGIYAVGFSDLQSVPDGLWDMYRTIHHQDVKALKELVQNCSQHQVKSDNFFSSYLKEVCLYRLPWKLCICYGQIYKCWRWGY